MVGLDYKVVGLVSLAMRKKSSINRFIDNLASQNPESKSMITRLLSMFTIHSSMVFSLIHLIKIIFGFGVLGNLGMGLELKSTVVVLGRWNVRSVSPVEVIGEVWILRKIDGPAT